MSGGIEGNFAEATLGFYRWPAKTEGWSRSTKVSCSYARCAAADGAADSISCWRSAGTTRIYTAH
jgi:hypothetical protein